MRKVGKAFAIGAGVTVIAVGGLLYAVYSSGLAAHSADQGDDASPSNAVRDQYWMEQSSGITGEGPTPSFIPQIPSVPLPSEGLGY
jgi:hypothetical protein